MNQSIQRIDVYYDRNKRLIRVDNIETNERLIYDDDAKTIYRIEDGICSRQLVQTRDQKPPQDIRHLFDFLDEIEKSNERHFNFIGQEFVQDIICDVFELVNVDSSGTKKIQTIHLRHVSAAILCCRIDCCLTRQIYFQLIN